MKNRNEFKWDFALLLTISILFMGWGIIMLVKNLHAYNDEHWVMGYVAIGGEYLIFFGLIFLVIAYFTLSPFSKIRKFFEGGLKSKKKK